MVAGYAGVAGFLLLEASSRSNPSMEGVREKDDDGTTQDIVIAYIASAVAAPVICSLPQARLAGWWPIVGVGLQGGGLLLRRNAMETLGRSYTRTIRTETGQPLVDDGPYGLVRHPGYLASILIWLGFALTSRSPLVVAVVAVLVGRAYERRIAVEERILEREIAGYAAYRRRTYRLIPFIW